MRETSFGEREWTSSQPQNLGDVAGSDVAGTTVLRAFLICDIRGYSTFTSQRGDEAAARLAMSFAGLARDSVVTRGGRVVELSGDEAFAVFASPAQAVRAGLEMSSLASTRRRQRRIFLIRSGSGSNTAKRCLLRAAIAAPSSIWPRGCAHRRPPAKCS